MSDEEDRVTHSSSSKSRSAAPAAAAKSPLSFFVHQLCCYCKAPRPRAAAAAAKVPLRAAPAATQLHMPARGKGLQTVTMQYRPSCRAEEATVFTISAQRIVPRDMSIDMCPQLDTQLSSSTY